MYCEFEPMPCSSCKYEIENEVYEERKIWSVWRRGFWEIKDAENDWFNRIKLSTKTHSTKADYLNESKSQATSNPKRDSVTIRSKRKPVIVPATNWDHESSVLTAFPPAFESPRFGTPGSDHRSWTTEWTMCIVFRTWVSAKKDVMREVLN